MGDRRVSLNALIGAAVTVVLVFIPFSSVIGGVVAGYLTGGDPADGLKSGALSGVFAAVPVLIVFGFIGTIATVGVMPGAHRPLAVGGAFAIAGLIVSLVYLVGFSAVGGLIGAAVRGDPAIDPTVDA